MRPGSASTHAASQHTSRRGALAVLQGAVCAVLGAALCPVPARGEDEAKEDAAQRRRALEERRERRETLENRRREERARRERIDRRLNERANDYERDMDRLRRKGRELDGDG